MHRSLNCTDLVLHTQSSQYPIPVEHKEFYSFLLEKEVPLHLVCNKKLRRVLHYIKHKYCNNGISEAEETEAEEEEAVIINEKPTKHKKHVKKKDYTSTKPKHMKAAKSDRKTNALSRWIRL